MATPATDEGRTKAARAVAMASRLRSALSRRSMPMERPSVSSAGVDHTRDPDDKADDNNKVDDNDDAELRAAEEAITRQAHNAADSAGPGCDHTQTAPGTDAGKSPSSSPSRENFVVKIEPEVVAIDLNTDRLREREQPRVAASTSTRRWGYREVLLQPDAQGLGLNVTSEWAHSRSPIPHRGEDKTLLIVSSFRRLHPQDIGPAEGSGQIRVGDVVDAINGVHVRSLHELQQATTTFRGYVESSTGGDDGNNQHRSPFVLLRLLREEVNGPDDASVQATATAPTYTVPCATGLTASAFRGNEPVAMLIRELVTRNQLLEEQLRASQLKQDEQRIQLEQLHTLYARTQLENWNPISLPKPLRPAFARRTTDSGTRGGATTKTNGTNTGESPQAGGTNGVISNAAARLMGFSSASSHDIEFAVNAERQRLARQFDTQLNAERQRLAAQYEAQMDIIRTAADKKIRMLDHAIQELLHYTPPDLSDHDNHAGNQSSHRPKSSVDNEWRQRLTIKPRLHLLRHHLFHQHPQDHSECVICLLLTEISRTCTDELPGESKSKPALDEKVQQLLGEIAEKRAIRLEYIAQFKEILADSQQSDPTETQLPL